MIHGEERPFECQLCPKTFVQKYGLTLHMRSHTKIAPYKCSFCDRTFTQSTNKNRHELTHSAVKPFTCTMCGKGYSTTYELKKHVVLHQDPEGKPFKCLSCNMSFTRKNNLSKHTNMVHLNTMNHACKVCYKKFMNADELKKHMESHPEGPPFPCKHCEETFPDKRQLFLHFRKMHPIEKMEADNNS